MTQLRIVVAAAALTASIAAIAYGQSGSQMDMHGTMQAMMPSPTDSPAVRDLKGVHMKAMMNAPKNFSGDPDVDFAQSMIAHHQAGIEMAKVELQYGKDAKQREFAQKVVADQQKDIAELRAWLAARNK